MPLLIGAAHQAEVMLEDVIWDFAFAVSWCLLGYTAAPAACPF